MRCITRVKEILRGEQNLEKLIRRGLVVGGNLKRMGGVIIDPSHCWHISIGDDVTLAPRVHILAHDTSTFCHLGYTRVANVNIGNRVFVGASAIILPGVTIGDDVIIGAGSVVSRDIPSRTVAAGVPAKVLCTIDEYLGRSKQLMNPENCFSDEYTVRGGISEGMKREMAMMAEKFGSCYVK